MTASTKTQPPAEDKNTTEVNNPQDLKSQHFDSDNEESSDEGGASPEERAAIADKLRDANPGDILIFRNAMKWNRLITWLTRSRYYHVGIYAGNHHVVESRPRGVICRDLYGPDGDRHFDVIPAPDGKGAAALTWAQAQLGADYDKSDAVAITLEQLFNLRFPALNRSNHDEYSCGEFVTLAFREAGAHLFPGREPNLVVPANFEPMLPADQRQK
jgi:cell wall-associated NlpC family hydrolase